jgi:hypothetical protein
LEKTPFRLTDKFIPGHYGHVALWVGTYNDLVKFGLADHPLIKNNKFPLLSGKSIVEALRPGVQLNSLEHFLNIDDLLVIRPTFLSDTEKRDLLIHALEQIGKDYDFNFDIETNDKIVCSEIAYAVFPKIDWPTENKWGRFTISPDQVAKKALDGSFDIILLYHDGKRIFNDPRQHLAKLLDSQQ